MFPPLLKGLNLLLPHLAYINNKIFRIPEQSILLMFGIYAKDLLIQMLKSPKLGGPAQVFPPICFFWRETYFFRSAKNTQKTDRRRTKRGPFFTTMRIAPPIVAIFRSISTSAGRSIGKLATVSARTIQ